MSSGILTRISSGDIHHLSSLSFRKTESIESMEEDHISEVMSTSYMSQLSESGNGSGAWSSTLDDLYKKKSKQSAHKS